jgi:hypothetical protein
MTNNKVGKYNATTGAAIDANFITGLSVPMGIDVVENSLLVCNNGTAVVGKYDATTGAVINANFITGMDGPAAVVAVPEPGAATFLLLGGLGCLLRRRRSSQPA